MEDDLKRKVEELSRVVTELKRDKEELKQELRMLKSDYEKHQHTGTDGSIKLTTGPRYNDEVPTKFGDSNILSLSTSTAAKFVLSSGKDGGEIQGDKTLNTVFTYEHAYSQSGLSAFYAYRPPAYSNQPGVTFDLSSGDSTLTDTSKNWSVNELTDSFLHITDSSGVLRSYVISSNTATVITINGTFGSAINDATYSVAKPVLLGSTSFPWQRLYVIEGATNGGIRFGIGTTADGKNGLLYMDSTGDLYWRNKSGTSTKLN